MRAVVIGAGPAGVMAALEAAKRGFDVVLADKNEKIGRKLYISGKGRCNVTNAADINGFTENIVSNPKFALSALRAFSNRDTEEFFLSRGVMLKTERGGRVFPVSDKASDIVDALYEALKKERVEFSLRTVVKRLVAENGRISFAETDRGTIPGDVFVLATGGKSYPLTGSDGSGYALARELGHTVIEPVAALSALETGSFTLGGRKFSVSETGLPEGASLKNIELTAYYKGGTRAVFGEALFTDNGISGPAALTLSSYINRAEGVKIKLDLKPALDEKTLDARLLREFDAAKNKALKNIFPSLVPASVAKWLTRLIPFSSKPANAVTKEERKTLVTALKAITLGDVSLAPSENAIVTAGGVKTSEIDPKTMKSRIIANLSFAGEIIDIDALTGGYNIQLALSTGYVAGKNL